MSIFQSLRAERARERANTPTSDLTRGRRLWGWVFLSPWLIGLLAFTILPIASSLLFSFTDYNLTSGEPIQFIGLENWRYMLFEDPIFWRSVQVTFLFAVIAMPLAIVVPVALAALLNSPFLIGKRLYRTLFYMPYIVPLVSAVYIWRGVLNSESGWINRFLEIIGIAGPDWLLNEVWIYPALNIIGLWTVGNAMLITLAAMQGVPTELYEAVRVDGGNGWTGFRHVTLPLISPVIFYNIIISLIGIFRYFEIPFILTRGTGEPNNSAMFINIHFYREAFRFQDMGYGSTLAWTLFILAMSATLIVFASSKYWVYYSAGEAN